MEQLLEIIRRVIPGNDEEEGGEEEESPTGEDAADQATEPQAA